MSNNQNKLTDSFEKKVRPEEFERLNNLSQKLIDKYKDVPEESELLESIVEMKASFESLYKYQNSI